MTTPIFISEYTVIKKIIYLYFVFCLKFFQTRLCFDLFFIFGLESLLPTPAPAPNPRRDARPPGGGGGPPAPAPPSPPSSPTLLSPLPFFPLPRWPRGLRRRCLVARRRGLLGGGRRWLGSGVCWIWAPGPPALRRPWSPRPATLGSAAVAVCPR